ncbi:MAG TPA: sigma-70 family RNA polymerase sigma factor [Tepidisphaeraceae bacterium]|jgi:RNA polymerase sigma factor (sigma-70 family)|nr:sigma-70 family RNA polymerase sigma factor [Tepidisphaeraceae bacterium]
MMRSTPDWELLREYAEQGSEPAFTKLVNTHVDIVYSAALRQVRRRDLAEEVTQVVFILLARKAGEMTPDTILPAWLHKTTRFTAANVLKVEARRKAHERKAAQMAMDYLRVDSSWDRLAPNLDEAIARLSEQDRAAILLRFFQHKSLAETGQSLGISEDAAGMRISRALNKLRFFFQGRGVALPPAALGGIISVNSVHAAPPTLGTTLAANALASLHGGVASAAFSAYASTASAVSQGLFLAKAKAIAVVLCAAIGIGGAGFLLTNYLLLPLWQHATTPSPQPSSDHAASTTTSFNPLPDRIPLHPFTASKI